jgi:hypothetical protein
MLVIEIKHTHVGTKAFWKGWNSVLFVNLGQFSYYWIRFRAINAYLDPDHGEQYQCGSIRTRIHNTGTRASRAYIGKDVRYIINDKYILF